MLHGTARDRTIIWAGSALGVGRAMAQKSGRKKPGRKKRFRTGRDSLYAWLGPFDAGEPTTSKVSTVPVSVMAAAIYSKGLPRGARKARNWRDIQPPPEPSPYSLRERAKRAAYEEWLKDQADGAPHEPVPKARDTTPPRSTAIPPPVDDTPPDDLPDTDDAGVLAPAAPEPTPASTYEAPAEAAYTTVPYRGGRTNIRDLVTTPASRSRAGSVAKAGPAKTPPKTPSKAPPPDQRDRPRPTPQKPGPAPGEVRAKKLASIMAIRVPTDRHTFEQMTPVQREQFVQDQEALRIGASREVRCGGGWCDLLTTTEIVEVKTGNGWRHALGQVLAYGFYWPDRTKRIHLFDVENQRLGECVRVCAAFGVTVTIARPHDCD